LSVLAVNTELLQEYKIDKQRTKEEQVFVVWIIQLQQYRHLLFLKGHFELNGHAAGRYCH